MLHISKPRFRNGNQAVQGHTVRKREGWGLKQVLVAPGAEPPHSASSTSAVSTRDASSPSVQPSHPAPGVREWEASLGIIL